MRKNILGLVIGVYVLILIATIAFFALDSKKEIKVENNNPVTIPEEILDNKFGFLVGGDKEGKDILDRGGAWARPHPGPFLWDSMQGIENSKISFKNTDEIVKKYQKDMIGLAPTIWPFATWDQKNRPDAEDCKVSDEDEFLPHDKFLVKDMGYIPQHRCNPNDWEKYREWIIAVVERYDGDGVDDMPGLVIPIKYWEVMNEPDLSPPGDVPADDNSLDFYKHEEEGYAELLKKTYQYIKEADPGSEVMIAGAAGGNDHFLDFYRKVFEIDGTIDSFDIANVHCISSDDIESFNLEPYKKLLDEFNIEKTVWVTESEAIISDDPDINATQTYYSTKKVLELGAERIFYTSMDFRSYKQDKPEKSPENTINITPEFSVSDGTEVYKIITSQ